MQSFSISIISIIFYLFYYPVSILYATCLGIWVQRKFRRNLFMLIHINAIGHDLVILLQKSVLKYAYYNMYKKMNTLSQRIF